MLKSILVSRSFLRFNFSKFTINETNFQSLKQSFYNKPLTSSFGEYFNYDNAMPIFSIISQAKKLQRAERIALLNELEAMCETDQSQKSNSDEGLNLLANIHFHKSIQLTSMNNFELAIKQLEAAIAIIEIMEYPDYFFLGELYRGKGQGHLRRNQLSKAQNSFLKAQNYLKQILDDFLEQQSEENLTKQAKNALKGQMGKSRVALAHTLTQLANTYIKQNKIYQSKSELQKSLEYWEAVPNYKGIPFYELTIRLKSLLHVIFDERIDALQSSNELLQFLQNEKSAKVYRTPFELNLAKIWHMNFIVSNYKESSNSHENLQSMKQKWEKRLLQLIKQSKQKFLVHQFENIMKSTGLTSQKLAKYGLV